MGFKKLFPVLLAVSLGLAGCGGSNGDNAESSANSASGQEVVTITSWRADQLEYDMYEEIQTELSKVYPNITLQFNPVKATEYNTQLNTALQTDTAADIIHLRPYNGAKRLADAGYLEPIDGLNGLDQFTATQLQAAQGSDNKQYGVPAMLSSTQIFYNTKIFEQNQLQIPQTWAELITAAETLKNNNITPFAFGVKEGWVLSLMHGAIAPQFYGSDFIDDFLSGQKKLNGPEFLSSIEAMDSLTPFFPNNFEGLGMDDIRTLFATEQAAMIIDGNFDIASIKALNPALEMDAFPVPPLQAGDQATISTWVDGSFGINKKTEHMDAAKKVLEFMTTKTYGSIILKDAMAPSPISGVTTEDPLINKISTLAETSGVPYMAVMYLGKGDPTTKTTFENEMQGMFLKALTPQQVADNIQKSADTWFTATQ